MLILTLGCTQQVPPVNNATACTEEAKICPDGSAVGRTGPNCTFAPCPSIVGNDTDAHGCKPSAGYSWCEAKQKCVRPFEEPCEGTLKGSDVMNIAQVACGNAGNLSDTITYNSNTKTYWINLDTVKPGCAPACVVWEENRSAEINWRCTGLSTLYTVKTANTSLGEILVDGNGFTLYTFSPDSENKSTCSGSCASNWPPLLAINDTVSIPHGLPGTIGAFARMDNLSQVQVTYNGMPLYTYAGDGASGDTNGQGIGGKWYVVNVSD